MKTYPGIYKSKHDIEFLYLDKSNYYSFALLEWDSRDSVNDHESDTNITREYLANTKVKIKSEEHEVFVREVASSANLKCAVLNGFAFIFDNSIEDANKEIHIPLPPKESEPKEWPQVGDEVLVLGLESNNRCFDFNGLTVKVLSVTTKHGNRLITFEHPTKGYGALMDVGGWMKKPLTPEEELAKELANRLQVNQGIKINDEKFCAMKVISRAIINCEVKGLSYKPE